MSMAINSGRGGKIQLIVPFYKVTRPFDHVVLQGRIKYFSYSITTTTRLMATKHDKVVPYYKKLQHIKSHNLFNVWAHEAML